MVISYISQYKMDSNWVSKQNQCVCELRTSTMVVFAALHIGWLKFLAVFLREKTQNGDVKTNRI